MIDIKPSRWLLRFITIDLILSLIAVSCKVARPTSTEINAPTHLSATPSVESAEPPLPTATLAPIPSTTIPGQELNISLKTQWSIGDVNDIVWSPDGNRFAIAYGEANGSYGVRLYSLASLAEVWSVQTGLVSGIAFSPNGNKLAVSPYDTGIQIWDANTGSLDREIFDNLNSCIGGPTARIAFIQNGDTIMTSYSSGGHGYPYSTHIYLWDVDSGQCNGEVLEEEGWLMELVISSDSRYIALALNHISDVDRVQVHIWDLNTKQMSCKLPGIGVAYSSVDSMVATGKNVGAPIELWNVQECQFLRGFGEGTNPFSLAFSPDGQFLVTGRESISIWAVTNGSPIGEPEELSGEVWVLEFSPDGRYLLSASQGVTANQDYVITLWDVIYNR
jgi:WD40 repeat protein